jgi:hypothetical protein
VLYLTDRGHKSQSQATRKPIGRRENQ